MSADEINTPPLACRSSGSSNSRAFESGEPLEPRLAAGAAVACNVSGMGPSAATLP